MMSEGDNYIDFQQRRGMALDIIDEALEAYRGFMLDDDYDAQATLDRIMIRMRERRELLGAQPTRRDAKETRG